MWSSSQPRFATAHLGCGTRKLFGLGGDERRLGEAKGMTHTAHAHLMYRT
jgi:hypothetical protein